MNVCVCVFVYDILWNSSSFNDFNFSITNCTFVDYLSLLTNIYVKSFFNERNNKYLIFHSLFFCVFVCVYFVYHFHFPSSSSSSLLLMTTLPNAQTMRKSNFMHTQKQPCVFLSLSSSLFSLVNSSVKMHIK